MHSDGIDKEAFQSVVKEFVEQNAKAVTAGAVKLKAPNYGGIWLS